jgi:3-hydroxyisobutyrate dehydrogenase
MDKTVGIIGIGIMGSAMAGNLLKDGFRVVGFDIAEPARRALARLGGEVADSPGDVARRAPIMITSLPGTAALASVVGGADGIAASGAREAIVIDCSTLPIEAKEAARVALARVGAILLDCPVSGTGAQAALKDLVVFASGDAATFERCRPVLEGMSRAQRYLGAFGNGSKMKFIANHLVTIHNVAAAEAIVLGEKAGLDPRLVCDIIADSAGSSRMFQLRGPLMAEARYDAPTATIKTHLKDLDIIGAFIAALNCPTPLFAAAAQLYHAGLAQGRGNQDTAAVCAVLELLAGITRPARSP